MVSNAILIHLFAAVPAMLLGAFVLLRPKGTVIHKLLGRLWIALMLITAVGSFGIKSDGQFSWIHILGVVTIVSIDAGLIGIRRGRRGTHQRCMQGAYSGLLIAFVFTLLPGRMVGQRVR
ncbi:MAG: DUF2306 domain-containing protein [Betaproteobacteria bacterium]|nr:DUF2306 domain-containing protein [Betaproteobacteria bacterium]